jgi:hypothetical protein
MLAPRIHRTPDAHQPPVEGGVGVGDAVAVDIAVGAGVGVGVAVGFEEPRGVCRCPSASARRTGRRRSS